MNGTARILRLRVPSVFCDPAAGYFKRTRAEQFAAQVNVGNVIMLRGEWNSALLDEMRMFPNGKYNDQIDALSRAFAQLLDRKMGEITDEILARI